jgi:hypothetical protein
MNRVFEIHDAVKVTGPLAELFKRQLGIVEHVYRIGGRVRYRVSFQGSDRVEDFFGSELQFVRKARLAEIEKMVIIRAGEG